MDKDFNRDFNKCPCCGGSDIFLEQLSNELKGRGLAREEWRMYFDVRQGVVVDQQKEAAIPYGSEVPGFAIKTDICMDCGCVYAVNLTRTDAKKSIAPPTPPVPPNRAERRRTQGNGGGRELIGPFSSS